MAPGPCLVAEKVGFEPTVPVKGLPDFEFYRRLLLT